MLPAMEGGVEPPGKAHGGGVEELYSRKDLYGNRDPPAATRALELAAAAADGLSRLPEPFRSFYAKRAARSLLALCE